LLLFNIIRDEVEESPVLLDHLGPTANAYLEKRVYDKYVGSLENSLRYTHESVKDRASSIFSYLLDAYSFVKNKFGGPEKCSE